MSKLVEVLSGKIREYNINTKEFKSGYIKTPLNNEIKLLKSGLIGDEQADKKHHGGVDKAILLYSLKNYEKYRKEFEKSLKFGSFGENFVVLGLNEINAFIGDVYRIGEIEIELTQPRQPCWKISKLYDKSLFEFVNKYNATGFYARVLKEGNIKRDTDIELINRKSNISIEKSTKILINPRKYRELIDSLFEMNFLADSYKKDLDKKLKLLKK